MRGILVLALLLLVACATGDGKPASESKGRSGTSLVPAAIQARSTNYKLVGTVTVGNGWTSSPRYTKAGGVVGATQ
jgi:hypothetical protein